MIASAAIKCITDSSVVYETSKKRGLSLQAIKSYFRTNIDKQYSALIEPKLHAESM